MYNANYSNATKLRENQGFFPNFQRVCLAEMNKQKITLLHTFWSQLEVEVSNICKRDSLSDISDMSEARILMKHPDARIPKQKVRSSNKQTFFSPPTLELQEQPKLFCYSVSIFLLCT